GVAHNITPQPRLFDVATDFALRGAPDQPGRFELDGRLDQRAAPSASVRLALADFPLQQLPLASGDALAVALQRALLNVDGLLRVEGGEIEFNLLGLFRQAELA